MIPYIMWICKCLCFEKLGYTSQMLQAFISGTFWIDCLITCKLPLEDFSSAQEKRAYIQGYVDCVQALYHMGLLKKNEGLKWTEKLDMD